jgi:tetraacyldisaccharide 4'-kinase
MLIVSRHCPQAVAVANPDRAAAGALVVEKYGVKVAILDDGFQHRRLGRDLDLLLIDATRPFGFGHCLPRGLLREPLRSIRRADGVILTRCDQCEPDVIDAVTRTVRGENPTAPIIRTIHRPTGFTDITGAAIAPPSGGRIGAFAGIARPDPFLRTLADLNIRACDARWWPDHHAYDTGDLRLIAEWARDARLDALVTTEKDAVKLARLDADWPVPIHVLAIEIAMLDDGDTILTGLIDRMLAEHEDPHDDTKRPAETAADDRSDEAATPLDS